MVFMVKVETPNGAGRETRVWSPRDLAKGNNKGLGALSLWVQLRNSIYMEALIVDTGVPGVPVSE